MKNVLVLSTVIVLSGCASIPSSTFTWISGDYSVSAKRTGCNLGSIEVKNNGSEIATISGNIDILDDQSNTLSTVRFVCDNAHPGGVAMCKRSQNVSKLLGSSCEGYSKYKLFLRKY